MTPKLKNPRWWLTVVCIVLAGLAGLLIRNKTHESIEVFAVSAPASADPYLYDSFVHHLVFTSVHATLVTKYKLGNTEGLLAKSWENDSDFKTWQFDLKPNLKFEDGSAITPRDVINSWTRMAFLMKKNGSKSELFDDVVEIENIQSPTTQIAGFSIKENSVVIRFRKSAPNVLDLVSFGLYSVTSSKDYDSKTGAWLDNKKTISSGAYAVESWTDSKLTLKYRDDFGSGVGHPKPFKRLNFIWDPAQHSHADIVMGDSNEVNLKPQFDFYGGAESSIAYVKCRSAFLKTSPCYNPDYRRTLREAFYREMKLQNISIKRSFFPLAIKGVHESVDPVIAASLAESTEIKFAHSKTLNPVFQAFNVAADKAISATHGKPVSVDVPRSTWVHEYNQELPEYSADLYMLSTAILIEDPMSDIKFMFQSKEGARLPDPTGKISKMLKDEVPNVQKINDQIWDDAVVWPVTHYASGLWARDFVDFSEFNTAAPPGDFQWIGAK